MLCGVPALAAASAARHALPAARLLGTASALTEEVGVDIDEEIASAVRAPTNDETYELAYADGRAASIDEAVVLALSLD